MDRKDGEDEVGRCQSVVGHRVLNCARGGSSLGHPTIFSRPSSRCVKGARAWTRSFKQTVGRIMETVQYGAGPPGRNSNTPSIPVNVSAISAGASGDDETVAGGSDTLSAGLVLGMEPPPVAGGDCTIAARDLQDTPGQ